VQPEHRALADARATVDVLHGLLERVGNRGVHTLGELTEWQRQVTPAQREKRHLAHAVPTGAGVYLFRGSGDRVLYVGKARNLRARVRTYFTAAETRRRMAEMVAVAERVDVVVCDTVVEAEVRELRLIAAHKPPYNRRSKYPERELWVKLTVEPFPRLSVVRTVQRDGAAYLGPFGSAGQAAAAVDVMHRALPLRQCTARLPRHPTGSACVLAELGRCGAPCAGAETAAQYARHVAAVQAAWTGDPSALLAPARAQMQRLAQAERYEQAAVERDRSAVLLRALDRSQRLAAFTALQQLVAARRVVEGGWDVVVVRYGRLAAAGRSPRGRHPAPLIESLLSTAETVPAPPPPLPAGSSEEAGLLLRWLEQPGTRLVSLSSPWSLPVGAASAQLHAER
jgi:DNA polymerase-3 subunit epsilon